MGKKIDYLLNYREGGEDKSITISIDFLSKANYDAYTELMLEAQKVTDTFTEYKKLSDEINQLRIDRPDNYKEQVDEKIRLGKELEKTANKYDSIAYNEKRWRLLQKILIDNKIKPRQEEYDILKSELAEAIKSENKIQKKQKEDAIKKLEEREKLLTLSFWEECVEISAMMDFLSEVINKDIENISKKKVIS